MSSEPFVDRALDWFDRWFTPIAVATLGVIAAIALFYMETSAANYDPQYMRVLVERTMRFGGTYYENGIHNKGPLEPVIYELAGRLGGRDGFWFVIACFTMIASVLIGATSAAIAMKCGAPRVVAWSVAAAVVAHFTLSDADYAGVLYSRNITVTLLCVAVLVVLSDSLWVAERRVAIAVAVTAIAFGLAVQTLLTTAFPVISVGGWAIWLRRGERVRGRPVWLVLPAVSLVVLLCAPLWYLARGAWTPFIDGWWTYARFMSTATGRGLGEQLSLGWDSFGEYYGERPEVAAPVVLFLVVLMFGLRRFDWQQRALRMMLIGWWLGAWVELILSQRYSSHYYSILAVPTALMIAALVGDVSTALGLARRDLRAFVVLPLVATFLAIQIGGTSGFRSGLTLASQVDRPSDFTDRRDIGLDGRHRAVRAMMQLVSEPADPVLMWTSFPWPYLNYDRVPASRYIWKNFLLGEIYLAESGPQYVLPGTWTTFAADVERTDPTSFVVEAANPVVADTPFAELVDQKFTTAFNDESITLGFRRDLAEWLFGDPVGARSSDLGREILVDVGEPVSLAPGTCARLDGVARFTDPGEGGSISLSVGGSPTADTPARIEMNSDTLGNATVTSQPQGRTELNHQIEITGSVDFTIVAGARSVVLVVGGAIVGAVEIDESQPITIMSNAGRVSVDDLQISDPIAGSGCGR